jgi:hypothetical protein
MIYQKLGKAARTRRSPYASDLRTNILPRWGRDNVRPTRLQTFRPAGAGRKETYDR